MKISNLNKDSVENAKQFLKAQACFPLNIYRMSKPLWERILNHQLNESVLYCIEKKGLQQNISDTLTTYRVF